MDGLDSIPDYTRFSSYHTPVVHLDIESLIGAHLSMGI
jgi:hypothetical protein